MECNTLHNPLILPEFTVADLTILVPVHGADHGVYLCGRYLTNTCTFFTIISPLYLTLPGRWFITNWSSSAGIQPAGVKIEDKILNTVPTFIIFAENSESIFKMSLHVHFLPLLPHYQQEVFQVHHSCPVINLVEHILHLYVSGVLACPPHCILQILRYDLNHLISICNNQVFNKCWEGVQDVLYLHWQG